MEENREENYSAKEISEDELDEVTGGSEIISGRSMVFSRKAGTTPTTDSAVATGVHKKKKAKSMVFGRSVKATDRELGDSPIMKA